MEVPFSLCWSMFTFLRLTAVLFLYALQKCVMFFASFYHSSVENAIVPVIGIFERSRISIKCSDFVEKCLTSVKYLSGSWHIKESAFAKSAACWISSSSASIFPILMLSLIVPAKSDGSWETKPMFLLRNFKSSSFILWLSIKMSPEWLVVRLDCTLCNYSVSGPLCRMHAHHDFYHQKTI